MNKLLATTLAGAVFAGGVLAPDSWRAALQSQIDALTGAETEVAADADSTPVPPASAAGAATTPPPVPYASVQRPLRLAKGQTLGLSFGLFTRVDGGASLVSRLAALGVASAYQPVVDDAGKVWQMLVAGTYDNAGAAERDRAILADALAVATPPDIVLLPPAKK